MSDMSQPPVSPISVLEVFRHWWGEIAIVLSAVFGMLWKWRKQIATIVRRLLAVNGKPIQTTQPQSQPTSQPRNGVSELLKQIADRQLREDEDRALDKLADRIQTGIQLIIRQAATENATIYKDGIANLNTELQRLSELLSAERTVRLEDVKELRTRLAEMRKIIQRLEVLEKTR